MRLSGVGLIVCAFIIFNTLLISHYTFSNKEQCQCIEGNEEEREIIPPQIQTITAIVERIIEGPEKQCEHQNETKFAVVIPFIPDQLNRIKEDIEILWKIYSPCNTNSTFPLHSRPDLIFYFNLDSTHKVWDNITSIVDESGEIEKCFNQVRFISANLTRDRNRYPGGADYMFLSLLGVTEDEIFEVSIEYETDEDTNITIPITRRKHTTTIIYSRNDTEPYSVVKKYDYIFYNEPDCVPIREGWLTKLHEQCSKPIQPFWVKGSIYRGSDLNKLERNPFIPYRFHINGNSLYGIGDPNLSEFIATVRRWVLSGHGRHTNAYDTDLFNYLIQPEHYQTIKHKVHLFQFTNIVANMWHTEWTIDGVLDYGAYLIHGGENTNDNSKSILRERERQKQPNNSSQYGEYAD